MTKYIDKDALIKEIKKRIVDIMDECSKSKRPQFTLYGKINALENLLPFIDTLEVKEVDLEEEARKWEDKVYLECGYQDSYGTPHAPFHEIGNAFIAGAKLILKAQKGK